MAELKVRYSIQQRDKTRYSFESWSDLSEKNGQQLLNSFLLWERQLRKSASIQLLSRELKLDSDKLLNVEVKNYKKSLTDIG